MTKYHKQSYLKEIATSVLSASESKARLENHPIEGRFLATLCRYGLDAYIDAEGIIEEATFTDEINQMIWKCLVAFFDLEEVNPTLASLMKYADALGYRNFFEAKNEKDYLKSLFNLPVELQDARILGGELRKLQFKRDGYQVLEVAASKLVEISTLEPLSKIAACMEEPISDFLVKTSNFSDEGKFLRDVVDIHVANLFDNPDTVRGIQTRFSKYDNMIGGSMEPGTFHVIVARSGVGKSIHAANTAINVAKSNNFVILADLELDEKLTMNRILAALTGINGRKFTTSSFTEEEKDKINDAVKLFNTLPIYYINVATKEIDETTSIFKRILNKKVGKKENNDFKDTLIIYDYLRLNDTADISKSIMEHQALGFHAIKIKNTALQTKIPILTYLQANREGIEKEDSGSVAGSDRVYWLCDSMALFKRKDEKEIAEDKAFNRNFNRKMIWLKARNAEESPFGEYINYSVLPSCALVEGPTNTELRTVPILKVSNVDKNTNF